MSIYLGNIPPREMERLLNTKFSDEDMQFLEKHYQHNASIEYNNEKPVYHCYDIPFVVLCSCKDLAIRINEITSKCDFSKAIRNDTFIISFLDK